MSLTSDDIADIKQLMQSAITANNTVLLAEIRQEFKQVNQLLENQDDKMDEILNAVGADLNKHTAKLDDHETRLAHLEEKTA